MKETGNPGLDELNRGLARILGSPTDSGELRKIVIRPRVDERLCLRRCHLSPEAGLEGDHWGRGSWLSLPDGTPHPEVQVTIMNLRVIHLIAGDPDRWLLAGDNLYVDMDLGERNLPSGQRLEVGSAILEITGRPHTGCAKFARRFGADAVKFVNSPEGRKLRLRGVYARVVRAGEVRLGDRLRKL